MFLHGYIHPLDILATFLNGILAGIRTTFNSFDNLAMQLTSRFACVVEDERCFIFTLNIL